MSGSVVTRVEADILLVVCVSSLLEARLGMSVGREARKMTCRGMEVSVGGEQRRHVLRLDDEISAYAERCSRKLGWMMSEQVGGGLLSVPQFRTDFGYVSDGQPLIPARTTSVTW